MANNENLKPLNKVSKKVQREIQEKGRIANAKKQAERRTLKEELLLLLKDNDVQKKMSVAIIQKACEGDVRAWQAIEASVGEKPTDKIDNTVSNKDDKPFNFNLTNITTADLKELLKKE